MLAPMNAELTVQLHLRIALQVGDAVRRDWLPPGAEPDRVTFYVWPRDADSKFHFVFRPRFAMKSRATSSVLYDYYNPDEGVVIAPELFTIE
jgi:hypothetical protein